MALFRVIASRRGLFAAPKRVVAHGDRHAVVGEGRVLGRWGQLAQQIGIRGSAQATVIRVVRRTHLFAGLVLLPWVVLYGSTAFLFNHPNAFRPTDRAWHRELSVSDSAVLGLTPTQLAQSLGQALAAAQLSSATIVGPVSGTLDFAVRMDDTVWGAHYVIGSGVLQLTNSGGALQTRMYGSGIRVSIAAPESLAVRAIASAARREAGGRVGSSSHVILESSQFPPSALLTFTLRRSDTTWVGAYDIGTGVSTISRLPPSTMRSMRDLLVSLHRSSGYSNHFGPASLWAVFVDAMAALMLFWAVSGLTMWWQYRSLRRPGAIVIGVSGLFALVLMIAVASA